MVALNLIELFTLIFFLLFIILLLIAVLRRCVGSVRGKEKPEKKKNKGSSPPTNSNSLGSARPGQQIPIQSIQARIHQLVSSSSSLSVPPPQNIRTIYLGTANEVGASGRSVYTIPVSRQDLRRTSVVVVLDRRSLSSQGEQRQSTNSLPTIEESPPSYDDCVLPPQYSEVFP